METNVKIVGFASNSYNGKTLTSKGFDINYDGNVADVNAFSDGKVYYMRLGNQDIKQLLNQPETNLGLEERISSSIRHGNTRVRPVGFIIKRRKTMKRKHSRRHKPQKSRRRYKKTIHRKPTPYNVDPIDRTIY